MGSRKARFFVAEPLAVWNFHDSLFNPAELSKIPPVRPSHLLFCLLSALFAFACTTASAQERATRKVYPDGSYDETAVFTAEKKYETRSYNKTEKLTKIAVSNVDADGKVMRCAVYNPEGKLKYWEKYSYASDGRTLIETSVFKPTGELIMKMTREGKTKKVVDANGRVMPESEWKSLR